MYGQDSFQRSRRIGSHVIEEPGLRFGVRKSKRSSHAKVRIVEKGIAMKRLSHVLTAATLLFSFVAFPQQRGENYFPISVGAKWEYSLEYYAADVGSRKGKATTIVDGEEEINGKKYYKEVTQYGGIPGGKAKISYSRIAKGGIYRIDGAQKDRPELLHIPFPIGVGTSWKMQDKDGSVEFRVEGTETLEMFRQKYDECLKISFHGKSKEGAIDGIAYYARNVGCVRTFTRFGPIRMEILLEKYQK